MRRAPRGPRHLLKFAVCAVERVAFLPYEQEQRAHDPFKELLFLFIPALGPRYIGVRGAMNNSDRVTALRERVEALVSQLADLDKFRTRVLHAERTARATQRARKRSLVGKTAGDHRAAGFRVTDPEMPVYPSYGPTFTSPMNLAKRSTARRKLR